jgi:alpha-D-ribose 1-methylphosphonate 5-triphosphate synthase subunit PhnG
VIGVLIATNIGIVDKGGNGLEKSVGGAGNYPQYRRATMSRATDRLSLCKDGTTLCWQQGRHRDTGAGMSTMPLLSRLAQPNRRSSLSDPDGLSAVRSRSAQAASRSPTAFYNGRCCGGL